MASSVGNILRTIAPIALGLAVPGIGSALGLGALGTAGLGAGVGGLTSALTGGNALTGALTGGIGGYAGSGGLNGLFGGGSGTLNGLSSSGLASQAAKDASTGFSGGGLAGALTGGGLSSYAQPASNILGAINTSSSIDDAKKQLLEAQGKSEATLSPFMNNGLAASNQLSSNLSAGFNPGDLTQDPGYQFNLQQGQQALDRKQAASGNYFSGAALKDAQSFGQGLADNTYNAAYQRWLADNGQLSNAAGAGQNAANALTGVYGQQGQTNAGATQAQSNLFNGTLSNVLSGQGYNPTTPTLKITGRDASGNPIYGY